MNKVMTVRRSGWLAQIGDILMVPIMHLISLMAGAWGESPQRTHVWNVQTLTAEEAKRLSQQGRVDCKGVKNALVRQHWWDLILFHLPFLKKGWKQYVVLGQWSPEWSPTGIWYVGWVTADAKVQISKVPNAWAVRMLLGPADVSFFGVDQAGNQVSVTCIGDGSIGDHGPFCRVPLS